MNRRIWGYKSRETQIDKYQVHGIGTVTAAAMLESGQTIVLMHCKLFVSFSSRLFLLSTDIHVALHGLLSLSVDRFLVYWLLTFFWLFSWCHHNPIFMETTWQRRMSPRLHQWLVTSSAISRTISSRILPSISAGQNAYNWYNRHCL